MDKVVKVSERLMVVKLGDWGMFDECDLKLIALQPGRSQVEKVHSGMLCWSRERRVLRCRWKFRLLNKKCVRVCV